MKHFIINWSLTVGIFSLASLALACAINKWLLVYFTLQAKYLRWQIERKDQQLQKITEQNEELEQRWLKESYERSTAN